MGKKFDKFLVGKRFHNASNKSENDYRNPFENDFTRVVFSSAFRRLQDKTQVFQLDKGDFVRTRLTHSLEVSSLGRSIGLSVENKLIEKGVLSIEKIGCIPSILATAGLIHDLGNPPFGHFGESSIQWFFKQYFKKNPNLNLTTQQKRDFEFFDGNVQTFRILRKLQFIKAESSDGMNLTHAVLATLVKYPFNSVDGNHKEMGLSHKKFGFFTSEEEDFQKIQKTFNIKGRFVLTPLLEAADDIAYCVADIEDACKKGILTKEIILEFLENCLPDTLISPQERELDLINKFEQFYNSVPSSYKNKLELTVQHLRVISQGFLINAVVEEYCSNIDKIMAGEYDADLLQNSFGSNVAKSLKEMGVKKIFTHKSILENEIIGFNTINYILEQLVPVVLCDGKNENPLSPRFYEMISSNYRFIYDKSYKSDYNKLQLAADYVCGMTDNFALKLYHKWQGHK